MPSEMRERVGKTRLYMDDILPWNNGMELRPCEKIEPTDLLHTRFHVVPKLELSTGATAGVAVDDTLWWIIISILSNECYIRLQSIVRNSIICTKLMSLFQWYFRIIWTNKIAKITYQRIFVFFVSISNCNGLRFNKRFNFLLLVWFYIL